MEWNILGKPSKKNSEKGDSHERELYGSSSKSPRAIYKA